MAEAPCSCIGIQTIVGREDINWVGSLLPVSLRPISDGCTPNIGIGIRNSRISVRVIMT